MPILKYSSGLSPGLATPSYMHKDARNYLSLSNSQTVLINNIVIKCCTYGHTDYTYFGTLLAESSTMEFDSVKQYSLDGWLPLIKPPVRKCGHRDFNTGVKLFILTAFTSPMNLCGKRNFFSLLFAKRILCCCVPVHTLLSKLQK